MKVEEAITFLNEKINELEQQLYIVDTVAIPRYESDKQILRRMRDQRIKMQAMKSKIDALNMRRANGERISKEEELTADEITAALPEVFR